MIIDKKYDMSLWLIFSKDIKNRKSLINFLEKMPQELIEKIQFSLKYENGIDTNEVISVPVNNGLYYWYNIDNHTGMLEIGRMFSMFGKKSEGFHLILYPTTKEELYGLKQHESKEIGLIYDYYVDTSLKTENNTVDYQLISFDIYKNIFGGLCLKSNNYLEHIYNRYSVNSKNFEELSIQNLRDRKMLNRVMKRKNTN